MPQQPGEQPTYLVPGGQFVKDAEGRLVFVPSGPSGMLTPPGGPQAPAPQTGKEVGGPEFLQTILEGLTLAGGFTPGGLAIKGTKLALPYAIPAVMGAGALKGAVDPEATSLGQAAFEGGMEAGGRALGKGLPYAGTRVGLAFGGLNKAFREKQPEIAASYMRARESMFPKSISEIVEAIKSGDLYRFTGIPIGQPKQMEKELGRVGKKMETFERGMSPELDMLGLLGGADELLKQSGKSPLPMETFNKIADLERRSVGQHIAFRNPPNRMSVEEVPKVDVSVGPVPAPPIPSSRTDLTTRRNIQTQTRPSDSSLAKRTALGPEIETTPPPTDFGPPTGRPIKTTVPFREMGEIKRGYTGAATDIYKRANEPRTPGFDPVSDELTAKLWAAMGKRGAELQEAALAGDQAALEEMQSLNQQFANIAKMLQSTVSMRGGGKIFGDFGAMATRGSVAGVPAMALGRMMGMDPFVSGALGSTLGVFGAAPKSLSAGGMALGSVARQAPTLQRLNELRQGTRRRKPGEP